MERLQRLSEHDFKYDPLILNNDVKIGLMLESLEDYVNGSDNDVNDKSNKKEKEGSYSVVGTKRDDNISNQNPTTMDDPFCRHIQITNLKLL